MNLDYINIKCYYYSSERLINDNEGGTVKSTSKVNKWLIPWFDAWIEFGYVMSTTGPFET